MNDAFKKPAIREMIIIIWLGTLICLHNIIEPFFLLRNYVGTHITRACPIICSGTDTI